MNTFPHLYPVIRNVFQALPDLCAGRKRSPFGTRPSSCVLRPNLPEGRARSSSSYPFPSTGIELERCWSLPSEGRKDFRLSFPPLAAFAPVSPVSAMGKETGSGDKAKRFPSSSSLLPPPHFACLASSSSATCCHPWTHVRYGAFPHPGGGGDQGNPVGQDHGFESPPTRGAYHLQPRKRSGGWVDVPTEGNNEHRLHNCTVAPSAETFPPLSQPHFSDGKVQTKTKDLSGRYRGPGQHYSTLPHLVNAIWR